MKTEENLKNAFQVVRETFIELGQLMQDFEAELDGLESLHTGNEIGTEISKSLKLSHNWLFRYVARYYGVTTDDSNRNWYAGASMIYFVQNEEPIVPTLIIGVLRTSRPEQKPFPYWWVSSLYRAEEEREVSYIGNNWYKVKPVTDKIKNSEKWYDEGYYYSIKLTDIKNKQIVTKLAKELSNKFTELSK